MKFVNTLYGQFSTKLGVVKKKFVCKCAVLFKAPYSMTSSYTLVYFIPSFSMLQLARTVLDVLFIAQARLNYSPALSMAVAMTVKVAKTVII